MYHYLHRPWYTKQSTIYHSWQKPLRFVQSIVYGILMSFVSNKHITIFTDNDMYHANVATLGNRSPILNERIDNSFIIPDYPARSPFYVLSYIICRSSLFVFPNVNAYLYSCILSYITIHLINVRYSYFVPILFA